jgi:cell division protein FtsW
LKKGNEYWVLIIALSLGMLGLLMVFSSSLVVTASSSSFGSDPYFFVKRQGLWFCAGLVALMCARSIDLEKWRPFLSLPFLGLNIGLLVLVLLIGPEINGAQRWLILGGFQFQPAELTKLAMIFYMADFLARRGDKIKSFTRLLPALALFGLCLILIEREPDLSTALVLTGVFITMIFASGARLSHLLGMSAVGALVVVASVLAKPYRLKRITSFLDPEADPQGAGYHAIQSLLAIGSGGLTGRGFGVGHQKYKYLPEAHTDYIFSILAEELGLVGTVCVIFLFVALLYKGCQIALHCRRPYLRMVAIGVTFQLSLQALLNIGVVTGSTPSTGLPLPFISYGGTSLLFSLVAVGLLMNVAERNIALREACKNSAKREKRLRKGATLTSSQEESLEAVSSGVWENRAAGTRLTSSAEKVPRPAVEPGLLKRGDWSSRRRGRTGKRQGKRSV